MKYSIKQKNDSDKENAKQLELIMNHKLAQYNDISEIIKEKVDSFEFDYHRGISIQSINPMGIMNAVMPAVIGGLNHNIIIADDIELAKKMKEPGLIQFDCWENHKEFLKENHPYGWYRKFEKKRF